MEVDMVDGDPWLASFRQIFEGMGENSPENGSNIPSTPESHSRYRKSVSGAAKTASSDEEITALCDHISLTALRFPGLLSLETDVSLLRSLLLLTWRDPPLSKKILHSLLPTISRCVLLLPTERIAAVTIDLSNAAIDVLGLFGAGGTSSQTRTFLGPATVTVLHSDTVSQGSETAVYLTSSRTAVSLAETILTVLAQICELSNTTHKPLVTSVLCGAALTAISTPHRRVCSKGIVLASATLATQPGREWLPQLLACALSLLRIDQYQQALPQLRTESLDDALGRLLEVATPLLSPASEWVGTTMASSLEQNLALSQSTDLKCALLHMCSAMVALGCHSNELVDKLTRALVSTLTDSGVSQELRERAVAVAQTRLRIDVPEIPSTKRSRPSTPSSSSRSTQLQSHCPILRPVETGLMEVVERVSAPTTPSLTILDALIRCSSAHGAKLEPAHSTVSHAARLLSGPSLLCELEPSVLEHALRVVATLNTRCETLPAPLLSVLEEQLTVIASSSSGSESALALLASLPLGRDTNTGLLTTRLNTIVAVATDRTRSLSLRRSAVLSMATICRSVVSLQLSSRDGDADGDVAMTEQMDQSSRTRAVEIASDLLIDPSSPEELGEACTEVIQAVLCPSQPIPLPFGHTAPVAVCSVCASDEFPEGTPICMPPVRISALAAAFCSAPPDHPNRTHFLRALITAISHTESPPSLSQDQQSILSSALTVSSVRATTALTTAMGCYLGLHGCRSLGLLTGMDLCTYAQTVMKQALECYALTVTGSPQGDILLTLLVDIAVAAHSSDCTAIVLVELCRGLTSPSHRTSDACCGRLRQLAAAFGLAVPYIFQDVKAELYPWLSRSLAAHGMLFVDKVAIYVASTSTRELLSDMARKTLGDIFVRHASPELDALSKALGTKTRTLLNEHLIPVIAHIFIHSPTTAGRAKALLGVTSIVCARNHKLSTPSRVIRSTFTELLCLLVWELGSEDAEIRGRALHGIGVVVRMKGTKDTGPIDGKEATPAEVKAALAQKFLFLLFRLHARVRSNEPSALADNMQAARCLQHLLSHLTGSVDSFFPNVMHFLRRLLHCTGPVAIPAHEALWSLVIALTPNALALYACQITLSLLPALSPKPNPRLIPVSVQILEKMFVGDSMADPESSRWQEQARADVQGLVTLPDIPELSRVRGALETSEYSFEGVLSKKEQATVMRKIIAKIATTLADDSLAMRTQAASRALELLGAPAERASDPSVIARHQALDSLLLGAEHVDPCIVDLVGGLLRCSTFETDENVRLLCVRCLSLLGAIDPRKFPQASLDSLSSTVFGGFSTAGPSLLGGKALQEMGAAVSEMVLGQSLLSLLARQLRLQDRNRKYNAVDSLAFSIQRVLAICGCDRDSVAAEEAPSTSDKSSNQGSNPASSIWSKIPPRDQIVLRPYLWHPGNNLALVVPFKPQGEVPVFRSGMAVAEWVTKWGSLLMGSAEGRLAKIFEACRPLNEDVTVMLHLLPYLACDLILAKSQSLRNMVKEEFIHVLATATDTTTASQDCCQIVFGLIDAFSVWCRKPTAKGRPLYAQMSQEVEPAFKPLQYFLTEIPLDLLARAAAATNAHARALLYLEMGLRGSSRASLTSSAVSYKGIWQQSLPSETHSLLVAVFKGLGEPDGAVGLMKRKKEPSPRDLAILHAIEGDWPAALSISEVELARAPQGTEEHEQYITCLQNLSCPKAVVDHCNSIRMKTPSLLTQQIRELGVRASWELREWDSLEGFLANQDKKTLLAASKSRGLSSVELHIGRIVHLMQQPGSTGTSRAVRTAARHAVKSLLQPLSAACFQSYERVYPVLTQLQVLQELETAYATISHSNPSSVTTPLSTTSTAIPASTSLPALPTSTLSALWERSLALSQPTYEAREPVLRVRRFLLECLPGERKVETAVLWEKTANLAREAKQYQVAACATLHARGLDHRPAILDHVLLTWEQHGAGKALALLDTTLPPTNTFEAFSETPASGIDQTPLSRVTSPGERESRDFEARALLLRCRLLRETSQTDTKTLIEMFKRAEKLSQSSAEANFYLGEFADHVMVHQCEHIRSVLARFSSPRNSPVIQELSSYQGLHRVYCKLLPTTLNAYGQTMKLSDRFLYQSMPRFLTLWFEFGEFAANAVQRITALQAQGLPPSSSSRNRVIHPQQLAESLVKNIAQSLNNVNTTVEDWFRRLRPSQWVSAMPQLISRVCHPSSVVVDLLQQMTSDLLAQFPQHLYWLVVGVARSTADRKGLSGERRTAVGDRKRRAQDIINRAKTVNAAGATPQSGALSGGITFAELQPAADRLVSSLINLSQLHVEKSVTSIQLGTYPNTREHVRVRDVGLVLPVQQQLNVFATQDTRTTFCSNPYAPQLVTFSYYQTDVQMLSSMMRPKRIAIRGSDGKVYDFLAKPKDDLRKDSRMMDLNHMMNILLSRHPDSRQRSLCVRTYAVTPLTEECGLIEWVSNMKGLRQILTELYQNVPGTLSNKEIYQIVHSKEGRENRVQVYSKQIFPAFPPVFHRFFLNEFPVPGDWHQARLKYARTLAVMSIIGWVVGLGDRHSENILFDSTTGDAMHVDLACLFDKGKTLEVPEVTPFRLTPNIVDGLPGLCGPDGFYRIACELTAGVMRRNRDLLMNVLETFVHDPLVEWSKDKSKEHQTVVMENISNRLLGQERDSRGQLKSATGLSEAGQVAELIQQATSLDNLSRMYVWWMPWL